MKEEASVFVVRARWAALEDFIYERGHDAAAWAKIKPGYLGLSAEELDGLRALIPANATAGEAGEIVQGELEERLAREGFMDLANFTGEELT